MRSAGFLEGKTAILINALLQSLFSGGF